MNFVKNDEQLSLKIKSSKLFKIQFTASKNADENTSTKNKKGQTDFLKKETTNFFDLENDFLIRINVLQFSKNEFWIILSMHHIIGDRLSLMILNDELFKIYSDLENGREISLPPLSIQYRDYSFWKKKQKQVNYLFSICPTISQDLKIQLLEEKRLLKIFLQIYLMSCDFWQKKIRLPYMFSS